MSKAETNPGITVSLDGALGEEAYSITVDKSGVKVKASDPAGIQYALTTLEAMWTTEAKGTYKVISLICCNP